MLNITTLSIFIIFKMNSEKEFQSKLNSVFYKTSSGQYGARATELPSDRRHSKNGSFTNHLLYSGMWRNNSLNTRVDTEKYIDECSSKTFSSL